MSSSTPVEKAPQSDMEKASIRSSDSSTRGAELIGTDVEQRLLRKLDFTLVPLSALIFGINFVDRVAIGNAKIAGLEKDLNMHGYDYNIVLTIFYIFFIFVEVPSNLLLKRYGSGFLAFTIFIFGLATLCTAFVKNYSQLIATRVFLALAEGGTLPGLTYIMSRYYRRSELVLRVGLFFGIAPNISGAFAGLLCSGILAADDIGSVRSWRKIFLVEGIITMGLSILFYFIIPGDIKTTRLLNEEERALAIARMDADQIVKTHGEKERTTFQLVRQAFSFNTILCSFAYLFINVSFQGLAIFLPTVVSHLGKYTTVQSQLKTVPPYCAGVGWVMIVTYIGYKLKKRFIPILLSMPLVVIGYAISIATKDPHARYAACFLFIIGLTPSAPHFLAWGTDNAAPDTVRAVTSALIPGIGTVGAVIAVWTYLPTDAPDFHKGNTINLVTSSITVCLAVIGAVYCTWENTQRNRGKRNGRLEGTTREEVEQLGHRHPEFRYQL